MFNPKQSDIKIQLIKTSSHFNLYQMEAWKIYV